MAPARFGLGGLLVACAACVEHPDGAVPVAVPAAQIAGPSVQGGAPTVRVGVPVAQATAPTVHVAAQVGMARAAGAELDTAKLNTAKLVTLKLGTLKLGTLKLGTLKLGTLKLGTLKPGTLKPDTAQPDTAQPDTAQLEPAAPERDFDAVLLISVDGLRSDALIAVPGSLPAFDRLRSGRSTLNARTDHDWTITLPNHTSMLTGRHVAGEAGHRWIRNDEVLDGATIHGVAGAYIASAFDVAHDRGAWTGIFCGKPKFHLYDDSYDAERGAPDALAPDDGRDKIDTYFMDPDPVLLADALIPELTRADPAAKRFFLVHFAIPDLTGHVKGWDVTPGSAYMTAVGAVDAALGRVLDAIEQDERLRDRTAIVLTADHGGGAPFRHHDQAHMWVDYLIPFLVWTHRDANAAPEDLYAANRATRADPGLGRPRPGDAGLPPVRNGDAGNLCLDLLGFPPIPGSTVNAAQDLRAIATATARESDEPPRSRKSAVPPTERKSAVPPTERKSFAPPTARKSFAPTSR